MTVVARQPEATELPQVRQHHFRHTQARHCQLGSLDARPRGSNSVESRGPRASAFLVIQLCCTERMLCIFMDKFSTVEHDRT